MRQRELFPGCSIPLTSGTKSALPLFRTLLRPAPTRSWLAKISNCGSPTIELQKPRAFVNFWDADNIEYYWARGRQHTLLSPLDCLSAKAGTARSSWPLTDSANLAIFRMALQQLVKNIPDISTDANGLLLNFSRAVCLEQIDTGICMGMKRAIWWRTKRLNLCHFDLAFTLNKHLLY